MPPPRLHPRALSATSSSASTTTTTVLLPFLAPSQSLAGLSRTPSPLQRRSFSASPHHNATRLRRRMWAWINGPGRALREPLKGSTNYLGAYDRDGNLLRAERMKGRGKVKGEEEEEGEVDGEGAEEGLEGRDGDVEEGAAKGRLPRENRDDLRPFPLNKQFVSQAVLSEELRELVYRKVAVDGEKVVAVSAQLGISMERVAAVVRLKEVEKEWSKKGRTMAIPYAKAVLDMLPKTPAPSSRNDSRKTTAHESINDLPVHRATLSQIFHPVPESRHFTRADAAKAFNPSLLPADQRIPHPELILLEKARLAGLPRAEAAKQVQQFVESEEENRNKLKERAEQSKARHTKVVGGRRWDFVFEDCSVEDAGKDGRGRRGVGWRYGMPHEDRKKGQVKIPTTVEV